MTDTITYFSQNAKPSEAWMAYVVLPNGQRWGVYSTASTEDEAKAKIIALYESEQKNRMWSQIAEIAMKKADEDIKAHKEHHFAGKVWMIHSFSRAKKRVDASEVAQYEADGWVKGGPRSK